MRRLICAVLLAGGTAAVAAQQNSQPPPVIFRSEVNYVEVDATVTDAQGRVVSDLTRADFDVLEDGKSQKVTSFSRVDLPIERPERPLFLGKAIEPDVRTNVAIEGRVYLIVLDDLHIDFSRTPRVKKVARQFVESAIGVNDVAAVVFTGRNDAAQDFTSNPRLLLAAIDKFAGRKLPSATIEQLSNPTVDSTGTMQLGDDTAKAERAYRARSAMGSIRKLSEFMAGVRGRRKAMILFSEGIDYDVNQAMGADGSTASIVLEDIRNAVAASQRGNVAIYSVDPRGLFNADDDLIQVGGLVPTDSPGSAVDGRSLQAELRLSQESLRQVSVDTGGFSVLNTNDFEHAFDRIIRENSAYYLLGYYSSNDKRDGRFRKLQVRVARPGLTVRSRSGYVGPRGKAAAPARSPADPPLPSVAEAMDSPLSVTGVPMRVFAAPFKSTAPNAAIAYTVEMAAAPLTFTNRDGAWVDRVEVLNSAFGQDGKITPGDRQTLTLTLKPETYERLKAGGLRVVSQMDLPPGRYQIRFAAGDAGGKAGSVLYDIEVPDFTREPIALSGIALTSERSANAMATIRPKNPLGDYLPGPPVAGRDFQAGDTIKLFAEVYDNARSGQMHQVAIKTELRSDEGRVVSQSSERRSSSELQGKSGGYGFSAAVPLAGVTPGLYVIHVEAQAEYAGNPTVSRDVLIRVFP